MKETLKKDKANDTVISHLYGLIALTLGLDGKGDRTIDCPKTTANDIVHRRANPHREIQAHSHDPEVLAVIGLAFERRFKGNVHQGKLPLAIEELLELVDNSGIADTAKTELKRLAALGW